MSLNHHLQAPHTVRKGQRHFDDSSYKRRKSSFNNEKNSHSPLIRSLSFLWSWRSSIKSILKEWTCLEYLFCINYFMSDSYNYHHKALFLQNHAFSSLPFILNHFCAVVHFVLQQGSNLRNNVGVVNAERKFIEFWRKKGKDLSKKIFSMIPSEKFSFFWIKLFWRIFIEKILN